MKKTIIVLIALLLTLSLASALAETAPLQREETITLEGQEETFLATQFVQPEQYTLWYADADFEPTPTDSGTRFALRNNFLNADVHLDVERVGGAGTAPDAALQAASQRFEQDGWQVTPAEADSFPLADVQTVGFAAAKDAQIARVYTVPLASGLYTLTITYPMEAAEGWGARLFHVALTIESL